MVLEPSDNPHFLDVVSLMGSNWDWSIESSSDGGFHVKAQGSKHKERWIPRTSGFFVDRSKEEFMIVLDGYWR